MTTQQQGQNAPVFTSYTTVTRTQRLPDGRVMRITSRRQGNPMGMQSERRQP